jgi:hypothetical protein
MGFQCEALRPAMMVSGVKGAPGDFFFVSEAVPVIFQGLHSGQFRSILTQNQLFCLAGRPVDIALPTRQKEPGRSGRNQASSKTNQRGMQPSGGALCGGKKPTLTMRPFRQWGHRSGVCPTSLCSASARRSCRVRGVASGAGRLKAAAAGRQRTALESIAEDAVMAHAAEARRQDMLRKTPKKLHAEPKSRLYMAF